MYENTVQSRTDNAIEYVFYFGHNWLPPAIFVKVRDVLFIILPAAVINAILHVYAICCALCKSHVSLCKVESCCFRSIC